uniref:Serine protease, subtilase family n=1 Tax=Candidatus Kentrum sp. LPFa TaxID=2126335 RepID=A0A450VN86_9GAMM|nr:MAG: Serine protease, subtilase family [Candidatus Kentron sp. LPFa]VFK25418.1 MAG: Serine protease, subtilase family [Candidatus Kentron sp. LPFa]
MSDIGSNTYTRGCLYLNSYTTSSINYWFDRDWFRIHLNAGQRVRFDLEGSPTGRGSLSDTYLRGIYNSSGSYISNTKNDDGGSGRNSRVIFTASSTGYYYVAAGGYGSNTGTYRLTATSLGSSSTGRPDLVVNSGSASGNFTTGGRVYASVTVRNQGSGSAGSSYVGYYLSTNSTITTSDTRLDYDYVSSLRSGRSGNEYEGFYLPRNLRAGQTYYIGAIADYTGRVSESNEGNNARVLRSFTVPMPRSPDLTVTSLGTDKTSYVTGERIRITSTTKNIGNASVGYSYTKFYLSRDTSLSSSDIYLGNDYVSSLSAGSWSRDTITTTLSNSLSGRYYLIAKADAYGWRSESNESNNAVRLSGQINIQRASPDLTITSLGTDKTNYVAGQSIRITSTVKNIGNASVGSSYTKFYLSRDTSLSSSDTYLGSDYVSSLGAGGWSRDTVAKTLSSSLSGSYYVIAKSDAYGWRSESNEYNNIRVGNRINIVQARPDLTITSLGTDKTNYVAGQSIRITSTVKNIGNASVGYSYTKFYLSRDKSLSSSDIYLGNDYVSSLDAGSWSRDTVTKALSSSLSGRYYLMAKADAYGWRSESNEGNNAVMLLRQVNIEQAKPDLTITSLGVDKTSYVTGERIRITSTTKNIGNASTGYSYTKFYLSRDTSLSSSDTYLGSDYVSSLGAGGSDTGTITTTLNSNLSGRYYLIAKADATGRVSESNEGNNIVRVSNPFTVGPANRAPIVMTYNKTVESGKALSASSLFRVTDADGDTMTRYKFKDGGSSGGYFTVNGSKQSASGWIEVSASQLNSVQYRGGSSAGSERLYVRAYDGKAWSNERSLMATTTKPANKMPTVNNQNHYDLLGSFAVAAYADSKSERGKINPFWYGLKANDLGLQAKDYRDGDFSYLTDVYMKDGHFRFQNASGFVAQSVYNGKRTLIVSFAGTDSVLDGLHDVSLIYGQLNLHDIRMKPFKDSVHAYAKKNNFDQVLVTGHSLGGAMVETFMKSHNDSIYKAVTFASPGASVNYFGGPDSRITSFEREGDLVPDFPLEKNGKKYIHFDYQGSINWEKGPIDSHDIVKYREAASMIGDKTDILDRIQGEQYIIIGNTSDDTLDGSGKILLKDQYLLGFAGNDTLDGGGGNDRLYGGSGNDTYLYDRDEGHDTIVETSGTDTLEIRDDASGRDLDSFTDLQFSKSGNNLDIWIEVQGAVSTDADEGRITITNQGSANKQVERVKIRLDDDKSYVGGSSNYLNLTQAWRNINQAGISDLTRVFHGSVGSDELTGTSAGNHMFGGSGSDTLHGKGGNDFLYGGSGNDTYWFYAGSGDDQIDETRFGGGGTDTIIMKERWGATDVDELYTESWGDDEYDLMFSLSSNRQDMYINLTLDSKWGSGKDHKPSQGQMTIKGMNDVSSRVETLRIEETSLDISLASIYSGLNSLAAPTEWSVFKLASGSDNYGRLAQLVGQV